MIGNSVKQIIAELPSAKVFNFAQTPPPMQSNLD
jgi:hypothetical protein